MAVGEDKNKKDDRKGFAGLASLVSDVGTAPPADKKEPSSTSGASSSPPPPTSQAAQPQQRREATYQDTPQPSSGSSGGKWVLGIAAVFCVLWLIGQSNKNTSLPSTAYSPPSQSTTPSFSSPPAQLQVPTRPAESKPPVGQGVTFSYDQIAYCVAEKIRLIGAKSAVDNNSDSDVDQFNSIVADYNSRCSSFRYRKGALESVRSSIEPHRSQLEVEGRSRFARRPSSGSPSLQIRSRPPPTSPSEQRPGLPANAYVMGSNWYCNEGFRKVGNMCVSVFER